jgi:hypothetical protein
MYCLSAISELHKRALFFIPIITEAGKAQELKNVKKSRAFLQFLSYTKASLPNKKYNTDKFFLQISQDLRNKFLYHITKQIYCYTEPEFVNV